MIVATKFDASDRPKTMRTWIALPPSVAASEEA